jgi:hypothetical protein
MLADIVDRPNAKMPCRGNEGRSCLEVQAFVQRGHVIVTNLIRLGGEILCNILSVEPRSPSINFAMQMVEKSLAIEAFLRDRGGHHLNSSPEGLWNYTLSMIRFSSFLIFL